MSEFVEVVFPKDTQEGTQSFLSKWLKNVGDTVSLHEPIAEVSTDKVIIEISSPASGVITSVSVKENDEIQPGDVIGMIDPAGSPAATSVQVKAASATTSAKQPQNAGDAATELSPAVRKLLKEHNVSASDVRGSGRGGRVTTDDVLQHVSSRTSTAPGNSRTVPHSPMRKSISKHLAESLLTTAPHVTTVFECDFTEVLNHKASLEGTARITLTSYIVKALAHAISVVPEVNSRWHDDALEIFSDINIGIGTATPDGGLVVPVLHKVQEMGLAEVAARLSDITARARDNSLTREDVSGGTITISNYGMSGGLFATPIIINQPQSAILGVGTLEKRPKVISDSSGDRLEIRPLCYATLTIDHRVLDGFQANACMSAFKGWIEGKKAPNELL